jgi:hypothetical protein
MALTTTKYQSDSGGIYRIRLDAAKVSLSGNTAPAGAITDPNVEVEVSEAGSRRKFGIHPRGVRFSRIGTGTDLNRRFSTFIPALTPAAYTALLGADTITYKGQTFSTPVPVPET